MASGKMSPLLAIIDRLKVHCENARFAREEMLKVHLSTSVPREALEFGWGCENTSIGALCDLLEICDIPDEQKAGVIAELKAIKTSHCAVSCLIEELEKS